MFDILSDDGLYIIAELNLYMQHSEDPHITLQIAVSPD